MNGHATGNGRNSALAGVIKSDFAEGLGDSLILNDNLQGNAFEPERLCRGILATPSINIWDSLASLPLMCVTLYTRASAMSRV